MEANLPFASSSRPNSSSQCAAADIWPELTRDELLVRYNAQRKEFLEWQVSECLEYMNLATLSFETEDFKKRGMFVFLICFVSVGCWNSLVVYLKLHVMMSLYYQFHNPP